MERYLDKCLTSLIISDCNLMNQLEVLVIIDGAKDRSAEIAHTYQKKYPNTFRVIEKENGNYGSCINRGLKEATGKYTKVLDADDYFETSNFSRFLSILFEQDNDLIITNFNYVNEHYDIIGLKNRSIIQNQTLSFADVVTDFNTNLISMHELTYKTEIFKLISYHQTEGISYTDLEWCFLPMIEVKTVLYLDLVIYKYLIGREGQTVSSKVAMKMLSHKMKSGINMALQYEDIINKINHNYISYLDRRISWSLGGIYYNYLVSYSNILSIQELIDFDNELKEKAPKVYRLLNGEVLSPCFKIKYILYWRLRKNKNKIPFSLLFYKYLIGIYQKIKK